MSFLASLPIIGTLVDSIGNAVDKIFTSDAEKLQFKAEMMQIVAPALQAVLSAQAEFDKQRFQLLQAELQSGDRFVRWTRPAMMWLTFMAWQVMAVLNHPQADNAFYAFGLVAGLFSATRGMEKVVGKWANGKNGK